MCFGPDKFRVYRKDSRQCVVCPMKYCDGVLANMKGARGPIFEHDFHLPSPQGTNMMADSRYPKDPKWNWHQAYKALF